MRARIRQTAWVGLLLCGGLMSELACTAADPAAQAPAAVDEKFEGTSLFDGKSFDGWEGNLDWFRIEEGAIVGGTTAKPIPRNEFLCTKRDYADFELRLQFRVTGEKTNAGIQVRSRRIPNHHEMIGYQADIGPGYVGAIYDESRRKKIMAAPAADLINKAYKPNDWNEYRIRCEGKRVRLWINGTQTVDYVETDAALEQTGLIGLQIHSGPPGEIRYRDVRIAEIPAAK